MQTTRISSGIATLDSLIDSFHIGDNVIWEVDAGTSYELFTENFVRKSFQDGQKVIYISFNKSPQSVLNQFSPVLDPRHFTLIDCFTSGKGKNDATFRKYYDSPSAYSVVRINNPRDINEFTKVLTDIEDSLPPGARYVFDSITGMQDLWVDEDATFRFFTYMCPRLYDLDTVAYWILEKDAHSQKFKANVRHITQVVLDISTRKDKLFLKALKLGGRQNREAFKPHQYEIDSGVITVTFPRRELVSDVGSVIKEFRSRLGMSQKELADRIGLTSSFVSQVESNQISPSLNSFLQIAAALGTSPSTLLRDKKEPQDTRWLIRREAVEANLHEKTMGCSVFSILSGEKTSAYLAVISPDTDLKKHFMKYRRDELIHVIRGDITVEVDAAERDLRAGDSVYLTDSLPARWTNRAEEEVELLVVCH